MKQVDPGSLGGIKTYGSRNEPHRREHAEATKMPAAGVYLEQVLRIVEYAAHRQRDTGRAPVIYLRLLPKTA